MILFQTAKGKHIKERSSSVYVIHLRRGKCCLVNRVKNVLIIEDMDKFGTGPVQSERSFLFSLLGGGEMAKRIVLCNTIGIRFENKKVIVHLRMCDDLFYEMVNVLEGKCPVTLYAMTHSPFGRFWNAPCKRWIPGEKISSGYEKALARILTRIFELNIDSER